VQTAEGVLLSGDLALPNPGIGWTVFVPDGYDVDEARWVKSVWLPDGSWLSAATTTETYHDVTELMLAGAAWTVAIGLPLALLSGALLSRWVLHRLAPIAATAGQVGRGDLGRRAPLAGTGDEFDRLAGDINAMLDTIESLTRNLRNVSVGIAHELRTPLTRIRNRLVEQSADGGAPTREAIDGALAELDAALGTFNALLQIGQIEANAQRTGFEAVDFSQLVASLAEVYQPVAAEQGKQLSTQVAPEVQVRGNRELLAQMISNLLENAIEHTPGGTSISMELNADQDRPRLVVADNGPGIPAEEGQRIFERFYRLDRSRAQPGNGLGLSLVKSICSLHGFSVRLRPGGSPGARFEVSI
jgi:signal transduction histidine kinase